LSVPNVVAVSCSRCRRFLGAVLAGARVRCPHCRTWSEAAEAPQKPTGARKGGGVE